MRQHYPFEEQHLLNCVREGDRRAFDHLYEHYRHTLYRSAYQWLRDRETAEELVQEVFTNLWLRRGELCIEKPLGHYLLRSLKYEVMNHFRALAVRVRYANQYRRSASPEDEATQQLLSFNELNARTEKEIGKLPDKCRIVFQLSRDKGYSTREIAQALNISPKTVEAHVGKALKTLRAALREYMNCGEA